MPGESRDYNLVFKLDDSELKTKGQSVIGKYTEINQALELLKKTYFVVTDAASKFGEAITRGSEVSDIEESFNRLTKAAGASADVMLNDLNKATLQTVGNFDLMRKANEQLRAGLKPDEIITLSKAAKAFAEEDGRNYQETLAGIQQALVSGRDQFLKTLGIIIDNKQAYKELGESLGLTGEKLTNFTKNLNEQGQAEAIRRAGVKQLNEYVQRTGEISKDAGDRVAGLSKAWEDSYDQLVKNLAQSPAINELLDKLIVAIPKVAKAVEGLAEALAGLLTAGDDTKKFFSALLDSVSSFDPGPLENFFKTFNNEGKATQTTARGISTEINSLSDWMEKNKTTTEGNADAIKRFTSEAEDAKKKAAELVKSFQDLASSTIGDSLNRQFEDALKTLDSDSIGSLKGKLIENFRAGAQAGIQDFIGTKFESQAREMAQIAEKEYAISLNAKESDALQSAINDTRDQLKDAFQEATDFFADLFSELADTGTVDLERRLKSIAVQFAAQLAASLATGLDANIGGGGIISGIVSSITGGGGGIGGLAGAAGVGGILGSFGTSGAAAYAAGLQGPLTAGGAFSTGTGILGALGPWGAGALAVGAIGSQTNWFGLGGGMSKSEKERRDIRNQLSQSMGGDQFQVGFGQSDLFGIDFKQFDESIPILNEAKDAVKALAEVIADGTDQGEAFSKIFAQVVTGFDDGKVNAENLNEVLIASQDLMGDLGIGSDDFKEKLLNVFYDGKISLDDFNKGLDLVRDNLIGQGSVADAVRYLAKTIDEDPRAALKAFQLAFKEASEVAGDQLGTVQDFFVQVFGNQAISVFNTLKAVGIKTFEDFASASVEQIAAVFNALQTLDFQAASTAGAIDAATLNPQGGGPVSATISRPSSGGGGSTSRGLTAAQKRQQELRKLRRQRAANNRSITSLFADITGGVSSTLDDSLLSLLGGGSSFSIADIIATIGSDAFQGLAGGAGLFGQNLTNLLASSGGSLAPDSAKVDINTVLQQLRRTIPQQAEFGPAAQLVSNVQNELNSRLFRGESQISIGDVRGLLGNRQGLFDGFGDIFGQNALGQAQSNVSQFADSVITDLRKAAGSDLIDLDNLKDIMSEAEKITQDSLIGPLQDAQKDVAELFGNTTKKGVQEFINQTERALSRLLEIRQSLQSTTTKAGNLLGALDQVGKVAKKKPNNLNLSA